MAAVKNSTMTMKLKTPSMSFDYQGDIETGISAAFYSVAADKREDLIEKLKEAHQKMLDSETESQKSCAIHA